ncbi:MAG: hypothetical protein HN729_00030 [Candidatus Marinimicrobia bacterium]|jgi:hypothetical protein|nr:hypothetical protein [Candidatus Neomarinimicrobiota bacterium]MBT3633542.1 hypothetical protein [Candidatus Neomarinimicrobiota bacterium]MBT3681684.1 hypothetical protein [Candidatus Neomarinimicrobiota bacterium]MBT3758348.1 hypothetical protein [Candidatus Neomarinimicrobiota bacterium]MBT3894998.1 hypothetical protein [Candidatus Neomarinimicrobiota bacterium]
MHATRWINRRYIILTIISIIMLSIQFGQNDPVQLSHEKKIYVDENENKLFWPKALPFFVRLAASPDNDAPSYLLNRVSPGSTVSKESIENGIELELSGNQYIRWFNAVTMDTVLLQFYSDGHNPKSDFTFSGGQSFQSNIKSFYGPGIHCSLSAGDELSGVDQIYYSVDDGDFVEYTGDISFSVEKEYKLQYYAVDNVGNVEEVQSKQFTIDTSPPTTEHVRIKVYSKNTLSPITELFFNGSDKISGLKDVYYQFDEFDDPGRYPDKHITINHLPDGEHTMFYYGVDQVGNKEKSNSFKFYLDNIPPVSRVEIQGDLYSGDDMDYISARSLLSLVSDDNKVGVDYIEYAIDEREYFEYEVPFAAPLLSGEFSLRYRAIDLVSNLSKIEKRTFMIDSKAPTSSYTIEGNHFSQAQVIWMTKDTKIIMTATDNASGVRFIEYQIGNNPVSIYSDYIAISKEGQYSTKSWCIDMVNNRVENDAMLLIVDNSPPEILESYNLSPIDTKVDKSGETINIYPKHLSISLAALDRSSGVEALTYSINGKDPIRYNKSIMFQKEGTFKISIQTNDKVNNSSSKEITLAIKG